MSLKTIETINYSNKNKNNNCGILAYRVVKYMPTLTWGC